MGPLTAFAIAFCTAFVAGGIMTLLMRRYGN
jgi:hypothetical protein